MSDTTSVIQLSENHRSILEGLANGSHTPKAIAIRSKIILLFSRGTSPSQIRAELKISYGPIYKWRERWLKSKASLDRVGKENKSELKKAIEDILWDAPRTGAPGRFTEEQVLQIIALSCRSPQSEGLPVSHWSCRLLSEHAQKLGIVKSISFKQINIFLKSRRNKTS